MNERSFLGHVGCLWRAFGNLKFEDELPLPQGLSELGGMYGSENKNSRARSEGTGTAVKWF